MAAFLDNCRFNPTAGGTTDWTYSTAVLGYQSPLLAGAITTTVYECCAFSPDQTQWEISRGACTITGGVPTFARTTVLYNSSGTGTANGQSGAGTKISFSTTPLVAVVAIKESLISIEEANGFTTTQKQQAQLNLYVAPTRTVLTSGSGTYNLPTGCRWIEVEVQAGGGGGSGSGTTNGAGGTGGNSTFGTSLLTCNGGTGGSASDDGGPGGTATGGDINVPGATGSGNTAATGGSQPGGAGASSPLGNGGGGGGQSRSGSAGQGYGAGGGGAGGGGAGNIGPGGGSGGYARKLITAPSSTYNYAVGAAGTAGTAGTGGSAGGAGAPGIIVVTEHYAS